MPIRPRSSFRSLAPAAVLFAALLFSLPASFAPAQTRPAAAPLPATSEKDIAAQQEELIRLLRLSPTLTSVVARDPSLLSNGEYVKRNNPELAQFLDSHPEIALNPDFYLFTKLDSRGGDRSKALEREVWPDFAQSRDQSPLAERLMGDLAPMVVFVSIVGMLVWLVRQFLENRRWNRLLKLQIEVHGKLIDRMSSNQELLSYMETEAGKRFLEAAPIPVTFEPEQRVPSAVARILTPLQIGAVLSPVGLGFLLLRRGHAQLDAPMLVLGTLFLMPGLGFILSAGLTWLLAGRLGMIPPRAPQARLDASFEAKDRQ